jgi:hypothetical protein
MIEKKPVPEIIWPEGKPLTIDLPEIKVHIKMEQERERRVEPRKYYTLGGLPKNNR